MRAFRQLFFPAALTISALFSATCLCAQSQPAQQVPTPPITANVNEVLVPVVVTDAQGRAVGDLKKQNFEVFDNGKSQPITSFNLIIRTAGRAASPSPSATPVPAGPVKPPATARRYVAFVFDNLNLSFADLAYAKQAATKILQQPLPTSDQVDILATSGSDAGFTRDPQVLQAAVQNLTINNLFRQLDSDCPNIDYYWADQIVNKHNAGAFQAAVQEAQVCQHVPVTYAEQIVRRAAERAITIGDQNFRTNLNFLSSVVTGMAKLPGQRVIILVSPGFLTPNEESTRLLSAVIDRATEQDVTISAMDARGLYTTSWDASETAARSTAGANVQNDYRQASMKNNENVLASLADGTGGTFFHNNNDLNAGFEKLFAGPEFLYLLAFSPDSLKAHSGYHHLKVKVDQRGLKLQFRRGYYIP